MPSWAELAGPDRGARYAARFAALAASGADVHGEARLCAELAPPGARVLDAGCGTGRVAIRLAELGYECVGVDVDEAMLAEARSSAPGLSWLTGDLVELAGLELGRFALVLAAGNVIALVDPSDQDRVVATLAGHLSPDGLLVAGFGLDAEHLPAGCARVALSDYDAWCAAAGLRLVSRLATWAGDDYTGGGYAVSVHQPK